MPPDGRLADDQIATLRKWIQDGAIDPRVSSHSSPDDVTALFADLWSLKPRYVDDSTAQSIDAFVSDRLTHAGLTPHGDADRTTLLRRASFDLTGLPPTPEEIEEFVNDDRPDAWQHLIDRLLESPRYGERWGRHWLDLARYGDSNGADINYAHANAWRYRDYVIQSFNNDKPYDQFIREQLAGDLLTVDVSPDRKAELLTATGFLMLGPKMLAEVDGDKLLMDIVDEQLDVAGKTFLGMTFGCARCHDHKFDPITSRDYYALAGIFRSTKVMDSLRPEKVVGEWVEVDVTSPEVRDQIEALTSEKQQLELKLAALGQTDSNQNGDANAARRAVVASDLPMLQSTTWAARVRIDSPQNLGAVISADYAGASQGHSLGFDRPNNGQAPRVVWNHGGGAGHTIITSPKPISYGDWHHLAVTYDAETGRLALYVDGEPAASASNVASTPFSTIGVGRRESAKQFQLIGDVDDVVVYDSALTQEELVVLDAGQQLEQKPVLSWDFESSDASHVIDSAGQHNGRFVGIQPDSNIITDGYRGNGLSLRTGHVLNKADKQKLAELRSRLKTVNTVMPSPKVVMAVQADQPVDLPIHIRGNHTNPGKEVISRTTPQVFEGTLPAIEVADDTNGRLELANWITHRDHPLTARVMVNRIWQHHFGTGLVKTSSNFGARGEQPSHPDLLDWLAEEFIASGWSVKDMHRLIMTSDVYRRSSKRHASAAMHDPDNRLLAHFPVQRLEAELIRDSLLSISGELTAGSPGNLMQSPNMKRVAMTPTDAVYQGPYRGVYLPTVRVRGYEMFSIFDVADNGQHVAVRPQTLVAQQALFLMNNPFVVERAKQIAVRVTDRGQSDAESIEWLYHLMIGRNPSPTESQLLLDYLQEQRTFLSDQAAWQALAHSLICSNEFIHIR